MRANVTFIYHPRSGDRVVAEKFTPEIAGVKWHNGCRHIVGGCVVSFETARCGSWWRDRATALAKAIITAVGGVAWDEQGTVHLLVPRRWVFQAYRKMEAIRLHGRDEEARLKEEAERIATEATLVSSGCAQFAPDDLSKVVATWLPEEPVAWPDVLNAVKYGDQTPSEILGGVPPTPSEAGIGE